MPPPPDPSQRIAEAHAPFLRIVNIRDRAGPDIVHHAMARSGLPVPELSERSPEESLEVEKLETP